MYFRAISILMKSLQPLTSSQAQVVEEGLYPSWDAANRASLGLAEKLGYEFSREYPSYKVGKNEK